MTLPNSPAHAQDLALHLTQAVTWYAVTAHARQDPSNAELAAQAAREFLRHAEAIAQIMEAQMPPEMRAMMEELQAQQATPQGKSP